MGRSGGGWWVGLVDEEMGGLVGLGERGRGDGVGGMGGGVRGWGRGWGRGGWEKGGVGSVEGDTRF